MNFLSVLYAKAGITVDGVTELNNTATALTPATNDNSTKIATTAFVKNQNYYPYPTGTTAQYVRGDGSLATFSQGGGGGGSSVNYYLNGSVSQGTIGGNTYYEMSKNAIIGTNADFSINADGYVAQFVTDAGDPALLNIPGGNWNFEMFFSASSGGGTPSFYVELYKYDGTTLTLIASGSTAPESITGGTATDLYITALAVPLTTLTLTDRLAVRVYVNNSGRTITLHTQNGHLCQAITTFSTGLTALNGLTAQVQNFAVGTGGTDFNISSVTDTHTFNLPTASATKRGALSSIDWSAFDAKVDFGDLSATSPLSYNGSGVFSIAQSSTSTNGYLSSTDWNTFNNKQDALTNPVTGTGTAGYVTKWVSGSAVGNSIIQDNGSTATIGGALTANGLLNNSYSIGTSSFGIDSVGSTKVANGLLFRFGAISSVTNGFTASLNASNNGINYSFDYGSVGIGTTNPTYKLDVIGDSYTSGNIRIGGSNVFYFDTFNGGWYMQDTVWIRSYASKSLWMDSGKLGADGGLTIGYGGASPSSGGAIIAGSVGIGTNAPTAQFSINESNFGNIAGRTAAIYAAADSETIFSIGRKGSGADYTQFLDFGVNQSGLYSTISARQYTTTENKLILQPNGGSVGIGTTTPSTTLDVRGSANFRGSTYYGVTLERTATGGNIYLYEGNSPKIYLQSADNIIFNNGYNFGIGTATPDVFGRGYSGTILGISSAGQSAIELNSATGNGAYFDMGVAGTRTFSIYADATSTDIAAIGNRSLGLSTNGNNRIFISGNGNVGVNTNGVDAGYKLDVNGTARVSGNVTIDDGTNGRMLLVNSPSQNDIYSATTNFGAYKTLRLVASSFVYRDGNTSTDILTIASGGAATFSGIGGASNGSINIESTDPTLRFRVTGGTANKRIYEWRAIAAGGAYDYLQLRLWNDAQNSATELLGIASTGAATFSSSVTANGDLYLQNSGRAIVFNSNTNNNTQIYEVAGKIVLYTGAVDRLTIASNGIATFASSVIISTANNINPADNVNTVVVGNVGDAGWRAKGIGGSAAVNHNWTIAHNALKLYFGISNGVAPDLASWLVVSPSGAVEFNSLAGSGSRMVVADASGTLSTQAIPTGTITGSGTTNYLPKFTGASALGNSIMSESLNTIKIESSASPYLVLQTTNGTGKTWGIGVDNAFSNGINFSEIGVADGRLFIANGGKVGIGTTSPSRTLSVNGQIGLSDDLIATNSTNVSRFGYNAYYSSSGFNLTTENSIPLTFGTASAERMRITSGGNVYIGHTDDYGARFSVKQPASGNAANFSNGSDADLNIEITATGAATKYAKLTPSVAIPLVLSTTAGSNVGIGITTPSSKLSVAGNIYAEGNDNHITLKATSGTFSYVELTDSTSNGYLIKNTSSSTSNGALAGALYTYTDGNKAFQHVHAGTPLFTILYGGNVGIGTTSPARLLNISGTGTDGTQLQINGTGDSAGIKLIPVTGDAWEIQANISNQFFVYNRTDNAYRFLIDNTGNVGIGTTSPAYTLDVNGTARIQGQLAVNHSLSGNYGAIIYNTSATGEGLVVRGGSTASHTSFAVQPYDGSVSLFSVVASGAATFSSSVTVTNQLKIYDSGYPSTYATSLRTATGAVGVLQLGNNNDNYILAGNTNTGGYLIFRVNCTTESITSGVEALRLATNGTATFSSSVTATNFSNAGLQSGEVFNATKSNAGYFVAYLQNTSASGYGLYIQNGSNSLPAIRISNAAGTVNAINLYGSGAAEFTSSVTATNFIVPGGTSAQFLKADGSLDSNVYLTSTSSTFSYTASVTLSPTWQNTGVSSANLTGSGVYIVTCNANDFGVSGGQYNCTYTGIMYWFAGGTNGSNVNEIVLHHTGHADNGRYIYLRTLSTVTADGKTYLQISGNGTNSGASNYQLTFKKIL